MKQLILLLGIVLSFFLATMADGQPVKDPCHYSTEGTDFWFGFMQNRNTGNTHYIEISVTSRVGAEITVTYGPNETPYGKYSVGANASTPISIDYNLLESNGSETPESKGIHIVSTNPVNVYALNYRTQSSDVAVIYPTEALGTEYFAMCYSPRYTSGNESNSEFLIVATQDNTTVNITPVRKTDQGKPANVPFSITLNKGQSYQVQSSNTDATGFEDLTGSSVASNKPIAFFSGSKATAIPFSGYTNFSYDHLYEQIPPTITWGKEFYVVPLKLRTKDTYRILAAENSTVVKIEGTNTTRTLNRGEFYEFELTTACRIISTRKILLAQFCRSQQADESNGVGDPFMIILSPVVQKIKDVTFVAYESPKIQDIFYVNVITLTSEVGNITLDGLNISSSFTAFPYSEYSYAQVQITKGVHTLRNPNENGGFLAYVYGFGNPGNTESYGYGVGFNLDVQIAIVGNWMTLTPMVCQGKEIKLSVQDNFDTYQWNTGETGTSITVSKEDKYWVRGMTKGGCIKSDTLYLKVSDPKINLGKDTSLCGPGYVLDAGKDFVSYKWQDGSTNQKFKVVTTGDYAVTGTNEFGCEATDNIHVDVFQVPEVKITGDTLKCVSSFPWNSELKVNVANADPSVWNIAGAGKWTSIPTDGMEFQNIKPDGVTLHATKPGNYVINYVLTTKDGCSDSDSFKVGFFDTPESSFTVESPESTDKCSSYERIVTYIGKSGSTAKYTWDFGGLMVLDTIAPNQFKVSIGANKPNRTISLLVEEHGCSSPLTIQNIGVKPTFNFVADKVQGCDAMCVQFSSEVTIMDKVDYEWTFGDGEVSDLANPLHCYKDTGKYDVSLMVTNVIDGCRNGSVEPEMIKIYPTPKAIISADPATCYDDTVSFEYLNAKENSHGKWFAKGNQLLSDENTKATYFLKNEISEIGFIVEENKCSCDTVKVQVKRKPNFDFLVDEAEVCQPVPITLKAIPKDPNLQFSWSVDSLKQVSGDLLTHLFSGSGFYNVSLEAFSGLTGCSDVVTKNRFIHIYPLPVPGYKQNYKVATLDHPEITFSNETTGALSYYWDFGDGTTSEEINPKHKYTEIGEYDVVMQAVTDFGCIDTIGSRVKIVPYSFYMANAFRPDSDIPENRVFVPIPKGVDPANYKFDVFNRIGSTVFESLNPEAGWDGNLSNGNKAEAGVYVWIIKYTDIQGFDHLQKGSVMLVR
jgi:PKD repeat protein